jgi:hypothetical protein
MRSRAIGTPVVEARRSIAGLRQNALVAPASAESVVRKAGVKEEVFLPRVLEVGIVTVNIAVDVEDVIKALIPHLYRATRKKRIRTHPR